MNGRWTTWLLVGALLASLQWNVVGSWSSRDPDGGGEASACALGPVDLGLNAEERARVAELCSTSCRSVEDLEARVGEVLADLRTALAAPQVDREELATLVDHVTDLRRRSLRACVDSVLEIRTVLAPEQIARVLARCGPTATCSPTATCNR